MLCFFRKHRGYLTGTSISEATSRQLRAEATDPIPEPEAGNFKKMMIESDNHSTGFNSV